MKVTTPEISWHNKDPVYSVDVQSTPARTSDTEVVYRIATGGTDCHVVIWHATVGDDVKIEFAADLNRHQKSVNVVRFSPSGEFLASGDDDGTVIIWKKREPEEEVPNLFDDNTDDGVEQWTALKLLRGHLEDVYSLAWSPDSRCLVSGSVDNTAIVWNAVEAKKLAVLKEHKGFVQGVAWCPRDNLIATIGTDRMLRVFNSKTHKTLARVDQAVLDPKSFTEEGTPQQFRLFHDDTLGTFFRRLSFSPDGELLVVPAGQLCPKEQRKKQDVPNATFVFSTRQLKQPALYLPSGDRYTVAVSFCPIFFELLEGTEPVIPLPYRLVYAAATQNSILIYDTQHSTPLAFVSHIHYTRLSDLNWSADGRMLVIASTDGYCSCVTFSPGELGTPLADQQKHRAVPVVEEKKRGRPKKSVGADLKPPADPPAKAEKPPVVAEEEEEIKLVLEDTQDVEMVEAKS